MARPAVRYRLTEFILRRLSPLLLLVSVSCAQQPIGSVGVQDATVAGALEVSNGQAVLVGSTTVTAKDHTAEVTLSRGGVVRVCSTSGLHLTSGKSTGGRDPLMLALDRGAVEVKMPASAADVVMTPDLRFVPRGEGPLDLHLRVTRNGDTCVDNRGAGAPTLTVSDQFGDATYELRRGQHVLFEHGSLREVVDSESSPCGCPLEPVVSVADAGVPSSNPAAPGSFVATRPATEQHPFPAAISQGLSPEPEVPAAPAGVVHAQVATTLSYAGDAPPVTTSGAAATGSATNATSGTNQDGSGSNSASAASTVVPPGTGASTAPATASTQVPAPASTPVQAEAPPSPAPPSAPDLVHRIGRFFKRLFGRG